MGSARTVARRTPFCEIQYLTSRSYEWVLEADIEACFDTIDHAALMGRIRSRICDARVLSLVKAFLRSGVMTTSGDRQETLTKDPAGRDPFPVACEYCPVTAG